MPIDRYFAAFACFALFAAAVSGCDQTLTTTDQDTPPEVSLRQSGLRTVDLMVAGPHALRGLQAEVSYPQNLLKLKTVEAGKDARGLDRVFWSDVADAAGKVVVGLSDTRKVKLPARGAVIRLHFEPVGSPAQATVEVKSAVGSFDGGRSASLKDTKLSVKVQ